MDNKKVTELPLNGRNFLQFNLLVPGATQGVKGSQNQTQGGSITVNGAREQSNNFLLDGMDNNDLAINQYAVAISTEAIQEFKVQASTYSAEFGRSPGAQINIATKAGTNQIHGVLYEYLRNNDLDAKNFFDRPGPMPGYKRNQYGTSVGGPIKKNKTFYFGNFEGARIRQGITKVATEPTAAMKNGDFSALPTIIYDPSSLHTVNGVLVRNPFPGNIIPAAQISPVGQNVVNLYPTPNGPGTSTANGLFTSSPTKTDDFDQFTVRVDHRFNDSNTLFGRYSYSKENRFDTFDSFCASANNVPGFGCNTLNGGQQALADYIALLGPNKVNEARVSFTRVRGGIFQQNLGNDISTKLGIAGTSPQLPRFRSAHRHRDRLRPPGRGDQPAAGPPRQHLRVGRFSLLDQRTQRLQVRRRDPPLPGELPLRFERARHAQLHAVLHRAGVHHRVRRGECGRRHGKCHCRFAARLSQYRRA